MSPARVAWWLLHAACAADAPAPGSPDPAPARRVVAFGDVHGDLDATHRALRLAGVIDADGRWSGGTTTVVQVGDQLDRGDDERAILDLFGRLRVEAAAAGGAFHALLGNHEIMNVAGDLRYVTPGGFAAFADVPAGHVPAEVAPHARGRVAAFSPGGPYARRMAEQEVTLLVEGTIFAHGGVLPEHVAYGLDRLDAETAQWLKGERAAPALLSGPDAPVWSRRYSQDTDTADCALAAQVLAAVGALRMVVAHTPQKTGIHAVCDGRVWRVDTGMSRHYGGPVEVLELVDGAPRVLREP